MPANWECPYKHFRLHNGLLNYIAIGIYVLSGPRAMLLNTQSVLIPLGLFLSLHEGRYRPLT